MSTAAPHRYCGPSVELTLAPLVFALALLGFAGLLLLDAGSSPSPTPASPSTPVTLRLDSKGIVYFKDEVIGREDVFADLAGTSAAVMVEADEDVPVTALLQLMRWLKEAGVKDTSVDLRKPAP